jgi:hypothetical protein
VRKAGKYTKHLHLEALVTLPLLFSILIPATVINGLTNFESAVHSKFKLFSRLACSASELSQVDKHANIDSQEKGAQLCTMSRMFAEIHCTVAIILDDALTSLASFCTESRPRPQECILQSVSLNPSSPVE